MNNGNSAKVILFFYFGIFFLAFFVSFMEEFGYDDEESTGPNDWVRIVDLDYKAVVLDEPNNGGKLMVTEQVTFDIHAESEFNPFWELWRDLPEDFIDGLKVNYDVLSVKEIMDDGTEKLWDESDKLYWDDYDYTHAPYGPGKWYHSEGPYNEYTADYEAIMFYIEPTYRDRITFEIQYIMNNAAFKYSDVSDLYVTMFYDEKNIYLEDFDAEILVPLKDMPSEGNYEFHTAGTNSNTFEYTESTTKNPGYHTFSISLDEEDLKFKPYNMFLDFRLLSYGSDVHKFTDYAPDNLYSDDVYLEEALQEIKDFEQLPAKYMLYKIVLFIVAIFGGVLLTKKVLERDKKIREKHKLYEPVQTMEYFRDIPSDLDPYFAATLAFAKEKKKKVDIGDAYSAIMLSLVRKGYVELERIDPTRDWNQYNIIIKVLYKPGITNVLDNNGVNPVVPNKSYYVPNTPTTPNTPVLTEFRPEGVVLGTLDDDGIPNIPINNVESPLINQEPLKVIRINENGKELEDLTSNEEAYFNLITRHTVNGNIAMSTFQKKITDDYEFTDSFATKVEKSIVNIGVNKGYFQKANYNELKNSTKSLATWYLIIGLLILVVGNMIIYQTRLDLIFGGLFILGAVFIIASRYIKKFAHKYVLLTQYGEDEYAKWYALYNFLNSETLLSEKTVIDVKLWEKYLVYATAFGISEKVIKALEIHCPDIPATESTVLGNRYYRSSGYRSSSRSFRSATSTARSSSRSASYGGGYGGGGRGGGSGGGGH